MRVSIDSFLSGVKSCRHSMNTLREARVILDCDGEPALCRTTNFVECEIELNKRRYLLSMPLSDEALRLCEKNAALIGTIKSEMLGEYRILRSEMRYTTWQGGEEKVDLLLYEIPEGVILQDYISSGESATALSDSICNMQREFKRINICHHNLTAANIIVARHLRLYPMRLHDIAKGSEDDIDLCFNKLREYIEENALWTRDDKESTALDYNVNGEQHNYCEGILCVKNGANSYQYQDIDGKILFNAKTFLWCSDFKEGRAEVEEEQGMGLLNKEGEYIIKPIYEIVDYDVVSGYSRVKRDGLWALFDYEGHEILPFEDRLISDEDISLIKLE
ncbi:MAG: WG repeat-containing protein [Rikenellaceae bacterium]